MALPKVTDSVTNITDQPVRPVISASALQALFDEIGKDLKVYLNDSLTVALESTTDGSSGADNIGATPLTGGTANDVQGILEELDSKAVSGVGALNTHKTSADHDGRYYTESEVNALLLANQQGNHLGTWQGYSPVQSDPGIQAIVNEHTRQIGDLCINVKDYGAVGDGVTDDRLAIQNALDKAIQDNLNLYFPTPEVNYLISSVNINNNCFEITGGDFTISTDKIATVTPSWFLLKVELVTTANAVFNISGARTGINITNISMGGNFNYGFKNNDWLARSNFKNVTVVNAKEAGYDIQGYMNTFENCQAWFCVKKGFYLHGIEVSNAKGTSTTLNNCFVFDSEDKAFHISNMAYSSLQNCACDNSKYAYYIEKSYCTDLYSCGCEKVDFPVYTFTYNNSNITGFAAYAPRIVTNYAMDFRYSNNIMINGFYNENGNLFGGNYAYAISSGEASQNIVINDASIKSTHIHVNTAFSYRPKYKLNGNYPASGLMLPTTGSFNDVGYSYYDVSYKRQAWWDGITYRLADGFLNVDRRGSTATRNALVLSGSDIGLMFFDTTLNKPTWWNGTVWKDATGATV